MGLFTWKSKSKKPKKSEQKDVETTQPPEGQSSRNAFMKARSQPTSRRSSITRDPRLSMVAHPAYAQDNIIIPSNTQSYLPVPRIPAGLQPDRTSAKKAAQVLGVDARVIQSAPVSPKLRPLGLGSDENSVESRHDSVNSNVESLQSSSNPKAPTSVTEETALESAVSEVDYEESHFRRSISSATHGHERDLSRDSFRPMSIRRHTMLQDGRLAQLRGSVGRPELAQRGRSYQSVPSYSMPTNASRAGMQAESEYLDHRSEVPIAASRHRAYSAAHESPSSPFMTPQHHNFSDETESMRSFTPQPSHARHASYRSTISMASPPLAILDGLKVNRRGRILDEEGEAIGELIDGDIIDCVRQKANAFGEVLDEYGRVVGTVRTLGAASAVNSPAHLDNRNADCFSVQSQSPMLTPALEAQAMQRRLLGEEKHKYRMSIDIPPVPAMPAAYHDARQSPAFNTAVFEPFDATYCAELPADTSFEPLDDVPAFDLSEPFMPTPSPTMKALPGSSRDETPISSPQGEHLVSSAVPARSRQRGLSLPKEEPARPAAAPQPSAHVGETLEQVGVPSIAGAPDAGHHQEIKSHRDTLPSRQATMVRHPAAAIPCNDLPESKVARTISGQIDERPPTMAVPVVLTEHLSPMVQPVSDIEQSLCVAEQTVDAQHQLPKQEPVADVARSNTKTSKQPQSLRPILSTRAKTAPEPATAHIEALPPLPHAQSVAEIQPLSTAASGYNSAEESTSEAESVEIQTIQRKGVRISNLPPTTIPTRGLNRSLSDGAGLTKFYAMPSVPESEPLPVAPRQNGLLAPPNATSRAGRVPYGSRNNVPLPAFPRQSFTNSLPASPFAAANAAVNSSPQKRTGLPNKPAISPAAVRSAMARSNRYTMNAPLVSSPLSDRRRTMSHVTSSSISSRSSESTPFGSDNGSEKTKSDAISIISTSSKSRTYFTHAGRVTVEAGDLPPSMQEKKVVEVSAVEVAVSAEPTAEQKKKRRFSMKFGKKNNAIAAH